LYLAVAQAGMAKTTGRTWTRSTDSQESGDRTLLSFQRPSRLRWRWFRRKS